MPSRNQETRIAVATLGEVAQVYDVSLDTVKGWRSAGMPGKPKRYVLQDVSRWLRSEGPWSNKKKPVVDDPLLTEGDSPGLERYRMAKAEHAELDLALRRGELIERDKCRDVLIRWAVAIRRMGERLVKRYGTGVTAEFDQALAECEAIVEESLADDAGTTNETTS